jgi:hypothetical protein
MPQLNDIHSQLNPTQAARVLAPQSLADVQAALAQARDRGLCVVISGGRHAMGGQQFAQGGWQLDMRAMQQVLHADGERGLLRMQAGAMWPDVIAAARAMPHAPGSAPWAIRQKQTGVDLVSLGGSISANAHGRGLGLQPLGGDIEDLQLLLPNGELRHCSRDENAELFALAVGGYGLFGVICSATLRLSPRQRVRRLVDVLDLEDAQVAIWRRIEQGCTYGDFQFVIDADDPRFLTRGVMAYYEPVSSAMFRAQFGDAGVPVYQAMLREQAPVFAASNYQYGVLYGRVPLLRPPPPSSGAGHAPPSPAQARALLQGGAAYTFTSGAWAYGPYSQHIASLAAACPQALQPVLQSPVLPGLVAYRVDQAALAACQPG